MSFKLNHYAKPVNTQVKSQIEAALIEFCIGLVSLVFAFVTYDEEIVLFVSTSFVAGVCFFLTLHNLYLLLVHFIKQGRTKTIDLSDND